MRPFLAQAEAMIVPLRIGGGTRIKICEAMATGIPVVSTRVGAEGLRLVADQHLIIVRDVSDMARALVECIRQPARAADQASASCPDRWACNSLFHKSHAAMFFCGRG